MKTNIDFFSLVDKKKQEEVEEHYLILVTVSLYILLCSWDAFVLIELVLFEFLIKINNIHTSDTITRQLTLK